MSKSVLKVQKALMGLAALAALALGGSALADAASNSSSSTTQTAAQQPPGGGAPGRHVGANGQQEQPLSGDTAAKVKAAAEAKVSGGTVERVETDVDHGSPYEAHVRKSDGTELEVLVNKDFQVTAVNQMKQR
jgi:outer membrane lipoprotein SlyB